MRLLFAVFLLSLCALLRAAFAIARHIRRAAHKLPGEAALLTENEKPAVLRHDVRHTRKLES